MSTAGKPAGIAELGRRLRAGKVTAVALAEAALARIDEVDGELHAFVRVSRDRALADARRADDELAAGFDRGLLHGIPHALKDVFDVEGMPTTCHSSMRLDHLATRDSAVAEKLAAAGCVLLGKLATDEFAFGGPSPDLPFPPSRNPWNPEHTTGGSSSGPAAAVASGMVRFAMGTDTGGSIRGPAAFCGVVGLKPTYGRVSKRGAFPLSYTMDHCGPLAATVEDAAICLQAIAGYDALDQASADQPVPDYLAGLRKGAAGLRIGVPRAFFASAPGVTLEALKAIDATVAALRRSGAVVEDITLPPYAQFSTCGRVMLTAEAYAVHEADLRSRPSDYTTLTMQRIMLGATLSAADYIQALRLRRELAGVVSGALKRWDLLLTACNLATAPRMDSLPDGFRVPSAIQAYPFTVTGHPALAVPVTLASDGLPLAVQLVGKAFDEQTVLRAGAAVESLSGWVLPDGLPSAGRR